MSEKSEAIIGQPESLLSRIKEDWRQYLTIYAVFVVIFIFFSITLGDKGFLDPNNLLNIVVYTAMIAIMAVGMTFVLSAGEIDLSIGSVAGLASVTTALALAKFGLVGGILCGVLTGIVVGMINGLLTTRVGIRFVFGDLGHDGDRQRRSDVGQRYRSRPDSQQNLLLRFRFGKPWSCAGAANTGL